SASRPSIFLTRKTAATPASSRWLGAAVAVAAAVVVVAAVAAAVVVAVAAVAAAAGAVRPGVFAASAELWPPSCVFLSKISWPGANNDPANSCIPAMYSLALLAVIDITASIRRVHFHPSPAKTDASRRNVHRSTICHAQALSVPDKSVC